MSGFMNALMSGGLPGRGRNSESISSLSEKPLPAAPPNRTVSESPVRAEQAAPTTSSHRVRPSVAGKDSFQRPKKKVVWKGKTCTIALPLEDVKDHNGQLKMPLTKQQVADRLARFQEDGISIRGFDLTESTPGDSLTGQSRSVYPDSSETEAAFGSKTFIVKIPNKQLWDDYVKELQEEKLRALGVTLGDEEPPARSPSVMSSQSRQISSQSPFPQGMLSLSNSASGFRSPMEQMMSPAGILPGAQFPFPQAMVSPNMQPRSAGFHMSSQSIAYNRDRVFSPNALSSPPTSITGQQYLGSLPSSRGVSPLIDDRKQSIKSLISPIPEAFQNGHANGLLSVLPQPRQQGQLSPSFTPPVEIPLQQQVSDNLRQQTPVQYISQPDIASPLPQGRSHRHNVSASLQKEIDEAEYHLEASISRQLDADDTTETRKTEQRDDGAVDRVEPFNPGSRPVPVKSLSIVSDIETNPSQASSPKLSSAKLTHGNRHGSKASVSKLNVNAQEFVFNPTKSSFSPMFTFGEKSPLAGPNSATSTGGFDGMHSKTTSNTSAFSAGLNVSAPAFVPGKPIDAPSRRDFSFSSSIPVLKADAPAFTPGLVFGEIPGGVMDKRPNGPRVFSFGDMIQLPKKSQAVPIVKPESDDEPEEDEEGRPMQAESRSKRARRSGGSGDQVPLFASPQGEALQASTSQASEVGVDKVESSTDSVDSITPAVLPDVGSKDARLDLESSANKEPDQTDPAIPEQQATTLPLDGKSGEESNVKFPINVDALDYTIAEHNNEPDIPQVFEDLAREEEEQQSAAANQTARTSKAGLVPPSPLQQIPRSPLDGSETALNTADFLDAPASLASPAPSQLVQEAKSVGAPDSPLVADQPSANTTKIPTSIEDPFAVGDHDDGNHTDKSVTDKKSASSALGSADPNVPTKSDLPTVTALSTTVPTTPNGVAIEPKKSTLSAKAKPFVFNPGASAFNPDAITKPSITPTKMGRPDAPEFKPLSASQPILKSQSDIPSPEHAPAPPTLNLAAMLGTDATKQEAPPPKKPAFSGGLGASRYASEEPSPAPRKSSPPAESTPTPPGKAVSYPMPAGDSTSDSKTSPVIERPATPLNKDTSRRVSSPELSPFPSETRRVVGPKYESRPVTPEQGSLDQRIANGVHYVEPSFKEIDDVMQQLNGDDSDVGVERNPQEVWQSPRAGAQSRLVNPERVATPLSERPKKHSPSRLPTSSPNQLDRPFQYLPEQDFGSSDSERSKLRDAAAEMVARNARYSPSFKKPHHHVKLEDSPVRNLNRRASGSVSNWDDVVSSDEEADFQGRIGFFNNRVGHIIANALDSQLQPLETSLAALNATISRLGERSRSSRPRRSRSADSDADDEDEDTQVIRAVSPFMKDRKFEKLRSVLLDAVQQNRVPNEDLINLTETVNELKAELSKRQDPPVEEIEKSAVLDELAQSIVEIKTTLANQPTQPSSQSIPELIEAITSLKAVMPLQAPTNDREVAASAQSNEDLAHLTKLITGLKESLVQQSQANVDSIKSAVEDNIHKHMRGKSQVVKSSQESANVEKLQLQLAGLESMLKNAESRADEEYKLRRGVEDQLASSERDLKAAISEAAQQRDAAEETERSLRSFLDDHQQSKQHAAMLEEVKGALEKNLSDVQDKNMALEETIEEYRMSHDKWRSDLDASNAENTDLSRTVVTLREELEDGIAARQSLRDKFERIQDELITATENIARDQASWRHREEEHKAKHELNSARLEAEARTRERLEIEIERLEKQEREAMKARTLVEDIRSQNANLTNMVNELRSKAHAFQERSMALERDLHDAKERSRLEIQRLIGVTKADIDSANQQTKVVRANFEQVIKRLEDQITHAQQDTKNTKDRHQAMLEEASISRDTALREAAEAREAALQEHYRFHERTMHETQVSHERVLSDLKADHTRSFANTHEDHERSISNLMEDNKRALAAMAQEKKILEQDLNGRLTLSDDKILHLQDKVKHLEERLLIANSAAQAAAEAARTARSSSSLSPAGRATAPSLRGFDPQALRQTVETLQDQLGERERQIETLQSELDEIDKDAPNKVKERDVEITWLRELLGVRMDDMQDIIVQLSTPHFDRIAVRDAVIRLRANLQMEQQERERQLAGGVKIPSLSEIRASPKALPLAAAAAWGSWRKGQTSLSSLAEMAVPSSSNSADQTPSKSSPSSFLSGLLTPPNTNIRQTPRGRASLSRPTSRSQATTQRPLAGFSTPKRQISGDTNSIQELVEPEIPVTPALLTQTAYDADAPEGSHHYSLDRYISEPVDLPSEDNSQQGDNDNSTVITTNEEPPTSNPFSGPSIELAG